jgi:hypothetical protein
MENMPDTTHLQRLYMERYKEQVDCCNRLAAKYPELFAGKGKGCMSGAIGVEKGWWPLLEELCEYLESYRASGIDVRFAQIKEKFAALTVYINGEFTKEQAKIFYDKVEEVYNRSLATCEFCGSTSDVTVSADNGYWLKALCPDCHAKRANKEPLKDAKEVVEAIRKDLQNEQRT